jgi:hypothetical protein
VHTQVEKRDGKLDAVSEPRIFVGYENTLHQYRVLNPRTGKIERTANVEFFEQETWGEPLDSDIFPLKEEGELELDDDEEADDLAILRNVARPENENEASEEASMLNAPQHGAPAVAENGTFTDEGDSGRPHILEDSDFDEDVGDTIVVDTGEGHTESTSNRLTIGQGVARSGGDLETPEPDENDTESDESEPEHREHERQKRSRHFEAPDMNLPRGGRSRHAPRRHDEDETARRVEENDSTEQSMDQHSPIPPVVEPKSYKEAINSKRYGREWKLAIQRELDALVARGTWEIVDIPKGKNIVDNKWVFKCKYTPYGQIDRFKARLVARGFTQVYGQDYDETFAPTMRKESLRMIFAISASNGWHVHSMDVDNAFLVSGLEEEIYMEIPEGIEQEAGKCCRVRQGLYGLKQSARNWYKELTTKVKKCGFKSTKDPCVFKNDRTGVVMGVHVDDLIIAGKLDAVEATKAQLAAIFKMKDQGELAFFLGMRVQQDRSNGTIRIDQSHYAKELLRRFNMTDCNPVSSPSENYNHMKRAGAGDLRCDQKVYQEAVGGLLYLAMLTRPDIAFEVGQFSQFCQDPSVANWNGVLRVLRYVRGTINYGIVYGNGNLKLYGYCDSDYAAAEDRKCVFGDGFILNNGIVAWQSQKQTTNVAATMEAEYIASCEAGKLAIFLHDVLYALHPGDYLPITLRCDNLGTIQFAHNPAFHKRSKHIDNRYHYLRQLIEDDLISLEHVPTKAQAADLFTKPLRYQAFAPALGVFGIKEV